MNMDQGLTLELGGYALRNTLINHQFQTEIKKTQREQVAHTVQYHPKKLDTEMI